MPEIVATDIVVLRDGRTAVDTSSFTIPDGMITAVIGPNGSGKSTILHVIGGLLEPASGTLTVGGFPPHQVRERVSYVLQTTQVNDAMPLTVGETVLMARFSGKSWLGRITAADRNAAAEAIERLDLGDIAGRHLAELSGGQRQRTFVAQGLAQDHDVLLLDEPLTALDAPSAQVIDDVVHAEQASGRTIVLTTHDLGEASAADHVILLAGQVIASGAPGDVLTPANLEQAYRSGHPHSHEHGGNFLDDPAHVTDGRHAHRTMEG